jgi:hypothetical protein
VPQPVLAPVPPPVVLLPRALPLRVSEFSCRLRLLSVWLLRALLRPMTETVT